MRMKNMKMVHKRPTYNNDKVIILLIFIGFNITGTIASMKQPEFGDLYDCTQRTDQAITTDDVLDLCRENTTDTKIQEYNVFKFTPEPTKLKIFHCKAFIVEDICEVGFFGAKDKSQFQTQVRVTKEECIEAMKQKISPEGKLAPVGDFIWRSQAEPEFLCKWEQKIKTKTTIFEMDEHEASVMLSDRYIKQDISATRCIAMENACRPKEDRLSQLVWELPPEVEFKPLYEDMGRYTVYITNSLAVIPQLSTGGVVSKSYDDHIELDSGYLLTDPKKHFDINKIKKMMGYNMSIETYMNIGLNTESDRVAAAVSIALEEVHGRIQTLEHLICRTDHLNKKLAQFLMTEFPDAAGIQTSMQEGYIRTRIGQATLVQKCKAITRYSLITKRKVKINNHTTVCYDDIPVQLPRETKVKFLNPITKRLTRFGRIRDCNKEPPFIIMKALDGHYWKLAKKNYFQKTFVKERHWHKFIQTNRIHEFNKAIVHKEPEPQTRLSLLRVIQDNYATLHFLGKYDETQNKELISNLADGGRTIINSVEKDAKKVLAKLKQRVFGPIIKYIIYAAVGLAAIIILILICKCCPIKKCFTSRKTITYKSRKSSPVEIEMSSLERASMLIQDPPVATPIYGKPRSNLPRIVKVKRQNLIYDSNATLDEHNPAIFSPRPDSPRALPDIPAAKALTDTVKRHEYTEIEDLRVRDIRVKRNKKDN